MKFRGLIVLLSVGALTMAGQQREADSAAAKSPPQVKAGGIELLLPPPDGDYVEVGDRLRTTVFELLAPSTNRLLTAYVSSKVQQNLLKGDASGGLGVYAMVEVPRRAEYAELTSQAFEELSSKTAESVGAIFAKEKDGVVDEINLRLRALGGKPLALDRTETIGELFRKTDAFGWAMLMGVKGGDSDTTVTLATAISLLRVKQRIVFAYVYAKYESPMTIDSLRKLANAWTDQILAANK